MNYDENLTYDWLKQARDKKRNLIKESVRTKTLGNGEKYKFSVKDNGQIVFIGVSPPIGNAVLKCASTGETITTQFHSKYIEALEKAYYEGSKSSGYCPETGKTYSPRTVRGDKYNNVPHAERSASNHSFGMAIDFNPAKNDFIAGHKSEIENYPSFVQAFLDNGFKWLGDGLGIKSSYSIGDDMHFEVNLDGTVQTIDPSFFEKTGAGEASDASDEAATEEGGEETEDVYTGEESGTGLEPWQLFYLYNFAGIPAGTKSLKTSEAPDAAETTEEPESLVQPQVKCGSCGPIRLTDEQIARLNYEAGFTGQNLVTITRIVIGESNGCVKLVSCPNDNGSVDRGLYQFNSSAFKNISDAEALDPKRSSIHAYNTFKSMGFNPWRGRTKFHTLKAGKPDVSTINRANAAVQTVAGYRSTVTVETVSSGLDLQETIKAKSLMKKILQPDISQMFIKHTKMLIKENKLIDKKEAEKKFKIKYKTSNKELEKNKKLLIDMLGYFNKKLKFSKPVQIEFIEDKENSTKPLGKTAYYDPEALSITIFTTGRLFKDVLRSLGHELIHHKQHCNEPFENENTSEGYAQKNSKMREKEKEAYLLGNMLFRDWEDNYKSKHKGVK